MKKFLLPIAISTLGLLSTQANTLYKNGAQWYLNQIEAPKAWEVSKSNRDVIVAVLDSGINAEHPALKGKVLVNKGYDFVNNDSNATDDQGQGTAVAGCIAPSAVDGKGLKGLASNVKFLPVKVLDANNKGSNKITAKGVKYAADQGADIINLGMSSIHYSKTLQDAINYAWEKGAVIVASAGNSGNQAVKFPAAYDNVVAVSALNHKKELAKFSGYGSHIDIAAPGSAIITLDHKGGFKPKSGATYATSLVSGVAAMIASQPSNLSNVEIVKTLLDSSTDLGSKGHDNKFGHGLLNAGEALLSTVPKFASLD